MSPNKGHKRDLGRREGAKMQSFSLPLQLHMNRQPGPQTKKVMRKINFHTSFFFGDIRKLAIHPSGMKYLSSSQRPVLVLSDQIEKQHTRDGRPFCLGLPRALPSKVKETMLGDIKHKGYAIIDHLIGLTRATALLNELNAIFEYPRPLMKKSTSSIFVNGQMLEYEKSNVFSISDLSILDPALYNESDRTLLDADNTERNLARLAGSPIPLTLDFERWLRIMLLDVFDGLCIDAPPDVASFEFADGADGSTPLAREPAVLRLVNAHPKVAVSIPPWTGTAVAASYPPHFDDPYSSDGNRKVCPRPRSSKTSN